MRTIEFTNGVKEIKSYKIVSTLNEGCYKIDETIDTFKTDDINQYQESFDYHGRRIEEIKK